MKATGLQNIGLGRTGSEMPKSDSLRIFLVKMQRNFSETFRLFLFFNFEEKWPHETSREIFHTFHNLLLVQGP